MPTLEESDVSPGYRALAEAVGIVDLTGRTQLELTGSDRANFLHNFCTNQVRNLAVGNGSEAFVLNGKGHVIGHVWIFAGPSSLIVDTVPAQYERLAAHFDRYIIRENVNLTDRTNDWGELLVAGPLAMSLLESLGLTVPQQQLGHTTSALAGESIYLRRLDLLGRDNWMVLCRRESLERIKAALFSAGAIPADRGAFEMARIESGTPLYGRDIDEGNLPQEVNRDALAISFTKGCYLGQETVARIDALGHVNRLLVGVRFDAAEPPPSETALYDTDSAKATDPLKTAAIGAVTSSAYSPRTRSALALAYVRRGHTKPGTRLISTLGHAEVVTLPL